MPLGTMVFMGLAHQVALARFLHQLNMAEGVALGLLLLRSIANESVCCS